jgi:hypothetical protein
MSLESLRIVFEPGTRLGEAWRACGVELPEPRFPPWHAYRPDGVLVITVWRMRVLPRFCGHFHQGS